MITLNDYKKHLVEHYVYEIDNDSSKQEIRKQSLERQYSDEQLSAIINNTYSFLKELLEYLEPYDTFWKIPLEEDTTSYISLNLVGGYSSDTLYKDDKGRLCNCLWRFWINLE